MNFFLAFFFVGTKVTFGDNISLRGACSYSFGELHALSNLFKGLKEQLLTAAYIALLIAGLHVRSGKIRSKAKARVWEHSIAHENNETTQYTSYLCEHLNAMRICAV